MIDEEFRCDVCDISAERDKLKAERDEIILKYQEYVKLLVDELNEIAPLATVHGWKSSRYEQGKRLREEIERATGDKIQEGK